MNTRDLVVAIGASAIAAVASFALAASSWHAAAHLSTLAAAAVGVGVAMLVTQLGRPLRDQRGRRHGRLAALRRRGSEGWR